MAPRRRLLLSWIAAAALAAPSSGRPESENALAKSPQMLRGSEESRRASNNSSFFDQASVETYIATPPSLERCGTLHAMPPPVFERYQTCVTAAVSIADLSVPGILPHLRAKCWCQLGLGQVVRALGCCEHPDFTDMCSMQCEPDCAKAEAQKCTEDCPAICYESHPRVP